MNHQSSNNPVEHHNHIANEYIPSKLSNKNNLNVQKNKLYIYYTKL